MNLFKTFHLLVHPLFEVVALRAELEVGDGILQVLLPRLEKIDRKTR